MPELIEISGLGQEESPEGRSPSLVPVIAVLGTLGGLLLLAKLLTGRPGRKATGIPSREDFLIKELEGDTLGDLGIIERCRPQDRNPRRPAKDQKWCLWTSDGKKVLGRHPTKKKALAQERVIQMRKHGR